MSAVAANATPGVLARPREWQFTAAAVRLAAFSGLAGFATGHWARLVQEPPALGLAGAVLAAVALAVTLTVIGRLGLRRWAVHLAAVAATLAGLSIALVAAGLSASLLEPARWDDLANEIDRGLSGIHNVGWPHAGPDESVRLIILMGAPLLLSLAAALAFWPLRRAAAARALGLIALLVLYGLPVTEYDPGRPLLRGAALLALVAAWLWLPRLGSREALPAVLAVLAVGALSLPLAARLDSQGALIDYRSWNWFGGKEVTFNWNHSYGPLDWPREGTTLLNVRAGRAHYWKAETLDHFDGLRWVRSGANVGTGPRAELPARPDRRWDERLRVTVRALRTDFVVGAGTPYQVSGAGVAVSGSSDGTVRRLEEPLRRGDAYTVRTYAPKPDAREMRASSDAYRSSLAQYTRVGLPARGVDALKAAPQSSSDTSGLRRHGEPVQVPLRGDASREVPAVGSRLAASPYRRTFDLVERIVLGAPTAYDAAKRIERHLERNYTYSERPPSRRYPLESFLFEDRIGYCQQFSGAMALMLRMVGIPARVVSGFSPGSFNRDTREYRVRDLDAHSWVEVYFSGIGWVTFDPTPAAAPADRPGGRPDPSRVSGDSAGSISGDSGGSPGGDRAGRPGARASDGEGAALPRWARGLGVVALSLLVIASVALRRRRRRLTPAAAAEASLRELQRALPRLGWELGGGTTLLELERRLGRAAGPRAAAYVARLSAGRFARDEARPPDRAERRALRRELTANRGLRARLRGFVAIPPVTPFTAS